ncbi:MAG: FISUMP domain-containing protein, partial [Bacteroidales bacterium]
IGYRSYHDNQLNREAFGLLYNWYAAMQLQEGSNQVPIVNELGNIQGICPDGWYLPSENDFRNLTENYSLPELMSNQAASYWLGTSINNLSGFNAVPGGYYNGQVDKFYNLYGNAYFWITDMSNEEPLNCEINYSCPDLIFNITSKQSGYSIRCIKDTRDYIGIPHVLVR